MRRAYVSASANIEFAAYTNWLEHRQQLQQIQNDLSAKVAWHLTRCDLARVRSEGLAELPRLSAHSDILKRGLSD